MNNVHIYICNHEFLEKENYQVTWLLIVCSINEGSVFVCDPEAPHLYIQAELNDSKILSICILLWKCCIWTILYCLSIWMFAVLCCYIGYYCFDHPHDHVILDSIFYIIIILCIYMFRIYFSCNLKVLWTAPFWLTGLGYNSLLRKLHLNGFSTFIMHKRNTKFFACRLI